MKVALVGVTGVPLGKHKVRDPRLDQADKLVKADSKTYALVDVAGEEEAATADALVVSPEGRFELVVKDLEFAERRLEHQSRAGGQRAGTGHVLRPFRQTKPNQKTNPYARHPQTPRPRTSRMHPRRP